MVGPGAPGCHGDLVVGGHPGYHHHHLVVMGNKCCRTQPPPGQAQPGYPGGDAAINMTNIDQTENGRPLPPVPNRDKGITLSFVIFLLNLEPKSHEIFRVRTGPGNTEKSLNFKK